MSPWFWSWIVLAAVLAIAESFEGNLLVIPWAIGAVIAAALDAAGIDTGWQWLAFAGLASVLTVILQRASLRRRRSAAAATEMPSSPSRTRRHHG